MAAAELATELGWSIRNIYRDLEVLQQVGFPLFSEREGRNSRWVFMDEFRRAPFVPFEGG
jgi:predicted DNA-binding transcriptional regulator YafY